MSYIARLTGLGLLASLAVSAAARADGFGACSLWAQGVFVQWNSNITDCSSISASTPVSPFVPRGTNFVQLDPTTTYHETLQPCDNGFEAPNCYTSLTSSYRSDLSSALPTMVNYGYNVVRLTLDSYDLQNSYNVSGSAPISPGFVANLYDALSLIHAAGMFAILTISDLPSTYVPSASTYPPSVSGANVDMMNPASVSARGQFWSDLIGQLESLGALSDGSSVTTAIFAIDVLNEAHFSNVSGNHPFDTMSGSVTWSGNTYDLGDFSTASTDTTGRQGLANAATFSFFSTIRSMIPSSILITASTVTPEWAAYDFNAFNGVGLVSGNSIGSYPLMPSAVAASAADFVDLHAYLSNFYTPDTNFQSAGLTTSAVLSKPIMMSEYGALTTSYGGANYGFSTASNAATALASHMTTSCGYGFAGWTLWSWDVNSANIWNAVDASDTIAAALAPTNFNASSTAWVPNCTLPNANFIANINGTGAGIYASANGQYCWYDTWQRFLDYNNNDEPPQQLTTYTRIPPQMQYAGICGLW